MQKASPRPSVASSSWSASRCPASACCCSCGWPSAAPIPLKPKGYRFNVAFPEATQLAKEADVRISGVPVGKVKTSQPDKKTGADRRPRSSSTPQYAPIPKDAKRDPAPEDAARRDLRRADARARTGRRTSTRAPENGHAARRRQVAPTVELDEIFRAFDPKTRAAFREWMQRQAVALGGRGAGPQRRARQPRAVRRGHDRARSRSSTPSRAPCASSCATPATSSTRSPRATTSSRALIQQLQHGLRRRPRAQNEALQADLRDCRPSRTRAAHDVRPPDAVRQEHEPAGHPAAPGGARAQPDADRPRGGSRPTSRRCSATSTR